VRSVLLFVAAMVVTFGRLAAQNASITPQARLDVATETLRTATTDEQRFYALNDAAKQSFVLGNVDDAARYARELTELLPMFQRNWNYGNAIQDVNLVFGRIAVQEGRLDEARQFLLAAGSSPGSPQMNSFGPNMSLAMDLLAKGEREVVLEYFELCRKFWRLDMGRLDNWSQKVQSGEIPDFGPNLIY
jgi:hypothetical protein